MLFHEVVQDCETGLLTVKAPAAVKDFYDHKQELENKVYYNCETMEEGSETITSETLGAVLYDIPADCFSVEYEFTVAAGHEFGIALHTDGGMEKGYFLRMDPQENRIAWDMWPRSHKGKYQWQIKGDVPYQIETSRRLPAGKRYRVQIIREEDICVVYINDEVALSTRMYDHKGGKSGVYVIQGQVELLNCTIKTKGL